MKVFELFGELAIKGLDKADRQLTGLQGKVQKFSGGIKRAGIGMTIAGGAIVAGLGLALKSAVAFESSMREVNTMMGLGQEEFKEFSKDVQDLSAEMGVSAVDSAKALYQAISAGVPKENVLEFLKIATEAAIGGVTDTETAVDGLTTVINAFKLPIEDAQKVADIMFTTVKGGKTTFEELSASMFNVAPIAAAAGVSFEEVSAAIATMTKQGVPTSVATTQIRAALQQLLKPTDAMIDSLDRLELSFFNQTEASDKARLAISPLHEASIKATTEFENQSRELEELRTSYDLTTAAMAGMSEEMDEIGDTQARIRLEIRKIRFDAAKEDRELTDEELASISKMELSLESLGISYAELAIKRDDAGEAAEDELEILDTAISKNDELKESMEESSEAVDEAIQLYKDAPKDLKPFSEILEAISKNSNITTEDILSMFGSIEAGSAILALTGDNAEMFAADLDAMANAEGAATEAADEMAESTARQMDEMNASFGDIIMTIGNVLLPVLKDLMDGIKPIIQGIKDWMEANPGLVDKITKVVLIVGGLLVTLGPLLIMLPGIISALPILGAAFGVLLGPVGLVIAAIAGIIAIGVLIVKNWDNIKARAKIIWDGIVSFFKGVWDKIVGFFKDNWDKILAILFPAVGIPILIARNWDTIKDFFKGLWDNVASIFKNAWDGIVNFLSGIPGRIGQVFSTIKDIILSPFRAAWRGIETGLNWLIDAINSISFTIPDWVPFIGGNTFGIDIPNITLPEFKHGTMITEPTLLSSLRTGRPQGIAGEAGPERLLGVAETRGGGMVTNNFNIANLIVREEADVQKIARHLFRLQQDKSRALGG